MRATWTGSVSSATSGGSGSARRPLRGGRWSPPTAIALTRTSSWSDFPTTSPRCAIPSTRRRPSSPNACRRRPRERRASATSTFATSCGSDRPARRRASSTTRPAPGPHSPRGRRAPGAHGPALTARCGRHSNRLRRARVC